MKIKIVAAILDTVELVLYKENGETVRIPQGDARIKPIIDLATEPLSRGQVVEIDLTGVNNYQDFEEKSSGVVKFFRIAKKFVKHIFADDEPVEPIALGTVPTLDLIQKIYENAPQKPVEPVQKVQHAVAEIMAHATPVASPEVHKDGTIHDEHHTVIATVGDKIIPGMENLEAQFQHAARLGSTEGVTKFLERLAGVIDKRRHSVNDLLRFMEKADLPIADDGSIIAYKVLKGSEGKFVDCHTGQVTQRVGSYVCMDESMVDPDRRQDCSNGLHIARRGYLGSFNGNIIVLCKIAPEDVIAVPSYDSNKVRVCGYHILAEIPATEHATLRDNRPMTENSEAKKLLGAAIAGKHIERIEEVRITGSHGAGVVVTPLVHKKNIEPKKNTAPAPEAVALDDIKSVTAAHVDTKAVSEKATTIKKELSPEAAYDQALNEKVKKAVASESKKKVSKPVKTETAKPVTKVKAKSINEMNRVEKAQYYVSLIKISHTTTAGKQAYADLLALKKASKVSWEKLGVGNDIDAIQAKFKK